jgi:multisubunit Na+/H+ antiporter MnhE subunit
MTMNFNKALLPFAAIYVAAIVVYCFTSTPFPYDKVSLGLIFGMTYGVAIGGLIALPLSSGKENLLPITLSVTAFILFSLYLMRLIPLNMDLYHISVNAKRVSLMVGMLLGGFTVVLHKLSVKDSNNKLT